MVSELAAPKSRRTAAAVKVIWTNILHVCRVVLVDLILIITITDGG